MQHIAAPCGLTLSTPSVAAVLSATGHPCSHILSMAFAQTIGRQAASTAGAASRRPAAAPHAAPCPARAAASRAAASAAPAAGRVSAFAPSAAAAAHGQHSVRRGAAVVAAAGAGSHAYTAALIFDCDGVIVETEELHR